MKNYWILIGGIFGFLGVALGAFGAHGLEEIISPKMLESFRTGVLYQLIHTIAILAIGISGVKKLFLAAMFFSIGIVLFSFSLYVYSISGITSIAIITPLGGTSFLIGWVFVIISGISYFKNLNEN